MTGAAQPGSIGEAIARLCAEQGAETIVVSRSAEAAQSAADRLVKGGLRATGRSCDITSDASVEAFARSTRHVDGIVHNAGAPITAWDRPFLDVPLDDLRKAFEVDVLGAARLTRALLPGMRERRSGSLIFTSSTAALAGYEFLHEFSPAKMGVLGLMRGLAAEFGRDNVRSNAVAYGNIASPATYDALTPEQQTSLAQESPMRRWGAPRDAAGASVFLLSDLSAFVNGQTLVVDGGTVMR